MTPAQRAAMEEALFSLYEWATLIKHQYSGSRDAMNALQLADNRGIETIKQLHAALAEPDAPDCDTCNNRGKVSGLSQETYCSGCIYGTPWKLNYYQQRQELQP